MDTIKLRKLSWKSVLDFGKHQGQTVKQVYDLNHTRLLRWYYYNCSKISFLSEILRAIGINEEDEIPKPGKDPDKGEKLDERMDKRQKQYCKMAFKNNDKAAMGRVVHRKKKEEQIKEKKLAKIEHDDSRMYSKGKLQRKNHGHRDWD